ncbi:Cof-type HAD-IIB family hydrolase [Sediminicola luteus]|uniref:Haloacid dehalogenase n=1 Tax=Sediminicola luteus TaxID=319238 RepID=A0A2A4G578_9FLAO|nr:Cof-type HAD-IIB family hydrolase [Sediminicola luteus]PCE63581.1 haloacid dehalogenase [Sediminicola luteus]
MDLSGIKMVVTDMDGTLLNSNHEVSNRFYELYEELKKRDILFVAASGRQYNSIAKKLERIADEIIIVAENGGFAQHNGTELFSSPLKDETRKALIPILEGIPDIFPILCGHTKAFLPPGQPELVKVIQEYYEEYEFINSMDECQEELLKIALYHPISTETHVYPKLKHLEGQIKIKISGKVWLDLSDIHSHKGYAIEKLQKSHGISPDQTVVFGDYNNDLEMLQQATYSFAMANAHPNVKETANYETASNDENGVEQILEKVVAAQPL